MHLTGVISLRKYEKIINAKEPIDIVMHYSGCKNMHFANLCDVREILKFSLRNRYFSIHCPDESIRPLPNIHVLIVPCID